MNILKRRFKKSGKTIHQVAKAMNIDSKKVKEIIDNNRPLEGSNLAKVIDATERTTIEDKFNKQEMLQWYRNTDIKALRASWGYKSSEVAHKLGLNGSTYSHIENKRTDNPICIDVIYDFFHDDLNKNYVNGKIPKINTKLGRAPSTTVKQLSFNIAGTKNSTKKELKEIIKFFKEDLEGVLDSLDKSRDELAIELGVHRSYFSNCIHHSNVFTRVTPTMRKIYKYFKNIQEQSNATVEEQSNTDVKERPLEQVLKETKSMINQVDELNKQIEQEQEDLGFTNTEEQSDLIYFTDDEFEKTNDVPEEQDESTGHVAIIENTVDGSYASGPIYRYEPTSNRKSEDEKKEIKTIIFNQIQRVYNADLCAVDMEVRRSDLLTKLANTYKDMEEM